VPVVIERSLFASSRVNTHEFLFLLFSLVLAKAFLEMSFFAGSLVVVVSALKCLFIMVIVACKVVLSLMAALKVMGTTTAVAISCLMAIIFVKIGL